jgi:hypothetical protein
MLLDPEIQNHIIELSYLDQTNQSIDSFKSSLPLVDGRFQKWDDSYEDENHNHIDDDFEALFTATYPNYTLTANPEYVFSRVDNSILQEIFDTVGKIGTFPEYFENRDSTNPIHIILYQQSPIDRNLEYMSGSLRNLYIENALSEWGFVLQDRDAFYLNINGLRREEIDLPLVSRHELVHLDGQIKNRTYETTDIMFDNNVIGTTTDDFVHLIIDGGLYYNVSISEMHAELVAATQEDGTIDRERLGRNTTSFMSNFDMDINRFGALTPEELRDILNGVYSENIETPGNIPSAFMNKLALEMPFWGWLSFLNEDLTEFVYRQFESHVEWNRPIN